MTHERSFNARVRASLRRSLKSAREEAHILWRLERAYGEGRLDRLMEIALRDPDACARELRLSALLSSDNPETASRRAVDRLLKVHAAAPIKRVPLTFREQVRREFSRLPENPPAAAPEVPPQTEARNRAPKS